MGHKPTRRSGNRRPGVAMGQVEMPQPTHHGVETVDGMIIDDLSFSLWPLDKKFHVPIRDKIRLHPSVHSVNLRTPILYISLLSGTLDGTAEPAERAKTAAIAALKSVLEALGVELKG